MFNYHCKKTWFKYKRHKNCMESLKVGKLFPTRRPFVESPPLFFENIAPCILGIWSPLLLPHLDYRRVRWSPSTHLKVGKLFDPRRLFVEFPLLSRAHVAWIDAIWFQFCHPILTRFKFVDLDSCCPPWLTSSSLISILPPHLDYRRVRWNPSTHAADWPLSIWPKGSKKISTAPSFTHDHQLKMRYLSYRT